MSEEANAYARKIANLGTLDHSKTDDGENIATVCRDKNVLMTGPEAAEIWYLCTISIWKLRKLVKREVKSE